MHDVTLATTLGYKDIAETSRVRNTVTVDSDNIAETNRVRENTATMGSGKSSIVIGWTLYNRPSTVALFDPTVSGSSKRSEWLEQNKRTERIETTTTANYQIEACDPMTAVYK